MFAGKASLMRAARFVPDFSMFRSQQDRFSLAHFYCVSSLPSCCRLVRATRLTLHTRGADATPWLNQFCLRGAALICGYDNSSGPQPNCWRFKFGNCSSYMTAFQAGNTQKNHEWSFGIARRSALAWACCLLAISGRTCLTA